MPKNIDILTVVDPEGFEDNRVPLTTPPNSVPMVPTSILNKNVWMIAEHATVQRGQATWNLSIKASPGDKIRWWDTSVVQDLGVDMIIIGFTTSTNWSSVLENPQAATQASGIAYIQSGFSLTSLNQLKFAMNSFQNNYVYANVKSSARSGTKVTYHLIMAKLDTSRVGVPTLKGVYRFDPTIIIN